MPRCRVAVGGRWVDSYLNSLNAAEDGWGVLGGADVGSGALLLDCDGTLAETERDGHRLAFNKAFKEPDICHGF